jgi:hypothetical protein
MSIPPSSIPTFQNFAQTLALVPIPTGSKSSEVTRWNETYPIVAAVTIAPDGTKLTKFPKFTELPGELQTKIWGHTLERRTIIATEKGKRHSQEQTVMEAQRSALKAQQGSMFKEDSDEDSDEYKLFMQDYATNPVIEYSTFEFKGAERPIMFTASKSLKKLVPILGYKLLFLHQRNEKKKMTAVFFNPALDTLKLSMTHAREDLCNWQLAQSILNPLDLTLVRELILPLAVFEKSYYRIMGDIQAMAGLERLYLQGAYPVAPDWPQFVLKMNYKPTAPANAGSEVDRNTIARFTSTVDGETFGDPYVVSCIRDSQCFQELT